MRDLQGIIDRMKESLNIKTDVQLAKALNIKGNGVVSTWKVREKIPYRECDVISEMTGVSIEWLLSGNGAKYIVMPRDENSATVKMRLKEVLGYTLGIQTAKDSIHANIILETHDIVDIIEMLKDVDESDTKYIETIDALIEQLQNKPRIACECNVNFGSNKIIFKNELY